MWAHLGRVGSVAGGGEGTVRPCLGGVCRVWVVGGLGGDYKYWIVMFWSRGWWGQWVCWRRGRHVGGGMVGTLLWVVNVVGGVGSGEGAEGRWGR